MSTLSKFDFETGNRDALPSLLLLIQSCSEQHCSHGNQKNWLAHQVQPTSPSSGEWRLSDVIAVSAPPSRQLAYRRRGRHRRGRRAHSCH